MSKFVNIIAGGSMIVAGGILAFTGVGAAIAPWLITTGAGTLIGGVGTLIANRGGALQGFASTVRNPVAPWKVVYGRARVGGTMVHMHTWGDNNKMLDLVIVIAACRCEAIDAVLFDQQRLVFDTNAKPAGAHASAGTSRTPVQQAVNIASIARKDGVVTVQLNNVMDNVMEGDPLQIEGVSADATLNGTFPIAQILSQTGGSIRFTYLNGGGNVTAGAQGKVRTQWADFGRKVYFEPLLGTQTLGQTFAGMLAGTPYDGDRGNVVRPEDPDGLGGDADAEPNPWTAYHSLVGKTAVFLRLHYNEKYFAQGLPQISFLVRGKNDIFDPRDDSHGYTENAALCIADHLAHPVWGFRAEYGTEIPEDELIAAANICDEAVPLANSTESLTVTEPAYALNGHFDLTARRGEVLQNMLTACGGRLRYLGGQFTIWPAAWYGNSFAIGSNPGGGVTALPAFEKIAAGSIEWTPTVGLRDLYNGAKGTYISPANRWMAGDIPPYAQDARHGYANEHPEDDANLAADGGERRWLDVQLPFTISHATAQRLLKIELLRRRQLGAGKLTLNMTAYPVAPLDNILVTLSYLNWNAKQLEVTGTQFRMEKVETAPALVVDISVAETLPSIYEWSTAEELSPQGYVQPAIPGVGSLDFFARGEVPGFQIPYPWKPAHVRPLVGDALYTGPVIGGENKGRGTFGLRVRYGSEEGGVATANLDILGVTPPTKLSSIDPPQLAASAGSSGNLAAGTYVIAASAFDTGSPVRPSRLSVPAEVTIPPEHDGSGSIEVTIAWPPDSNGGEVFLAEDDEERGYHFQASRSAGQTTLTISDFDRSTRGAPDATFDHIAVAKQRVAHSGCFAAQVIGVTPNTITLGGLASANQWQGHVLSLLGRLDSQEELPELNMPVASNTATDGDAAALEAAADGDPALSDGTMNAHQWAFYWNGLHTPLTAQQFANAFPNGEGEITAEQFVAALGVGGVLTFAVTIGPNAAGDTLPDLTALLNTGDLLVMRYKAQFTETTFRDPNIANAYYPEGATGPEPGRKAMVLTGPASGDVQTIAAVSQDGNGKWTIFHLAAPWTLQPNDGDIVIVLEADIGPEEHGQPSPAAEQVAGLVASPVVTNLARQVWLFLARAHTAGHRNGSDRWIDRREVFVFGSQGTRTVRASDTMRITDATVLLDASAGDLIFTLLPFSEIPNRKLFVERVDSSSHACIVQCQGDDRMTGGVSELVLEGDGWNGWIVING